VIRTASTRTRLRALAVLALCGAMGAGLAHSASAAVTDVSGGPRPEGVGSGRPPAPLPPDAPTPGAGHRIQSVYAVTAGTQTYTCGADGTWGTASVPEARLTSSLRPGRIHHYAGPRWTSERDGSTVVGAVDQRVSKDGTIPWLLLHVSAHENSAPGKELDRVSFISRINTSGGTAPAGACTAGTKVAVPYRADYVFWVPKA
jgi:hypothetical protein